MNNAMFITYPTLNPIGGATGDKIGLELGYKKPDLRNWGNISHTNPQWPKVINSINISTTAIQNT
jgi:hypothetical protein